MGTIPIGKKLPLKESTKRILHTIKKCRRKHTNQILVHLLSLLPKPNPTIDKSVLVLAYIEKLRAKIKELINEKAELLALQYICNCSAETGSQQTNMSSSDVPICNSASVSVNTNSALTNSETSNEIIHTDSEDSNVRIVFCMGHVTVTVRTTCSHKSLLLDILTVIQSHDAEVVHANLDKEDGTCFYLIHAKVSDVEKLPEKELLSALQALAITT
ncbi:hypothetical protein O6H91_16G078400 [Diphasiastrum complanatum]|nr:hypothetical protein O6H91_16G078400 [Diphasiastrum complanatum]KAJ7527961.1 hypothetical protein O6H91_16G078400 [Diphasiastrum complanatum]